MARKSGPKKDAASQQPRAEVKGEAGVEAVFALHKITYGGGKSALREIFTPVSQKERDYLLSIGAARELNDSEKFVQDAIASAKKDGKPAEPTSPTAEGTEEAADATDNAAASSDPDVIE